MLPRRSSKDATQDHVSPQSTSDSTRGRQPLSLVTTQRPFRASTTLTIETESPVSETSPQELPPIPPRPAVSPHLPPRGSGLRRQSTRRATHDTFASTIEEHDPPQPQGVPMPSPPIPQIPERSPTPTRLRRRASDGGIGGFRPTAPHSRAHSRDCSHYSAADYTYRFDTIPSLHSDSRPPHYESAGISEGIHAKVWPTYNKISQQFDEKRLEKWNTDLDVLLIFAGLFSAIVTAFLVRALDDLDPNYQQQTALLLHQLLNGRDPNLTNISDPTIAHHPAGPAIAVNCLWFVSLFTSLGASLGAMICKEWLTEYNSGTGPVIGLLRACRRHTHFMAFQRLNVHALVTFLPTLLHSSVLLFFAGAVVYLWRIDERVAIVCQVIGGIIGAAYLLSTILPFTTNPPFRPFSTFLFYRLSVAIGRVFIPILDVFVHACYLIFRHASGAILFPFARTIFSKGTLHRWYMQAVTILPGEYKHMRVWWANRFEDVIDTSRRVQEEAVLWLSQVPLNPSESKAVVSSLALISSSRPHKFPKPMIAFLNLALESSFREGVGQEQTDAAIDCILVLGHIKFQLTVDRNWDHGHNIGGTPVTASVAWAAQQLAVQAFQEKFNTPHTDGIRARLLTAAAWLSPVDAAEEVLWDGQKLEIQDRWEFIKEIKILLERHARSDKPADNKVLINLIHGMHACIPRGDYGSAASIIPFLPLFCEDYDSPWSEDESVLRALITFALDLLLPPDRREPLVERVIRFDELASELVNTLMIGTTSTDVVVFGFWLIYRVPYTFKSRKTMLADIIHIWTSTYEVTPEDHRKRLNFHAVDAFVAVAQCHVVATGALPKLTCHTVLDSALQDTYNRPMATYAMAMILDLGTSSQVATVLSEIRAESFIETLFSVNDDIERNAEEEDAVDLHIYSTLILLKFRPTVELDVVRVKGLIGRMEKTIGDAVVRDSGVARKSEADISVDLDRVRWKAIYLSALLSTFVPRDERERHIEGLWERARTLLGSGELSVVGDYERCLRPLAKDLLELNALVAEQRGPVNTAFEVWVNEFPLFPLAGSVAQAPGKT